MTPWIWVAILFVLLRHFERWLHQHIFKVGWLVTKNYETTTILYYTFFLPGVVLHELIYWLVAGLLNVRAERAITWPEKQEIGELRLNFVKLSKHVGRVRLAIISAAPLVVGILLIWLIVNNTLHLPRILSEVDTQGLTNIGEVFNRVMATPDVWLWLYLLFTISNTMFPTNMKELQGWWLIGGVVAGVIILLMILGVGDTLFADSLASPVSSTLNALSGTFATMIVVNLFFTAILSIIENTIELITGDSATFKDGKMLVMRRSEVQTMREQERRRERQRKSRQPTTTGGLPSIYRVLLPVPGPPGEEPVTQRPSAVVAPDRPALTARPSVSGKQGPDLVAGTGTARTGGLTGTTPQRQLGAPASASVNNEPDAEKDEDVAAAGQAVSRSPLPTRSPVSSFGKPSGSLPVKKPDTIDEDAESSKEGPARSGLPVRPPATQRTPAASPFSSGNQPSGSLPVRRSPFSAKSDEDETDETDTGKDRPAQPRAGSPSPGGFPRTGGKPPSTTPGRPASPFSSLRSQSDDDEDDETADDRPAQPRSGSPSPGGFPRTGGKPPSALPGRPASPFSSLRSQPDDDEDDDFDDEDDVDDAADRLSNLRSGSPPSGGFPRTGGKPPSSLPGRPASPFSSLRSQPDDDEDDDFDDDDDIVYEDVDDLP